MPEASHDTKQHSEPAAERRQAQTGQGQAFVPGVPGMLLGLQRSAGNQATQRAIQRMAAGHGFAGARVLQRHGTPEDDPLDVQAKHDPLIQRHGTPEDDPLDVQAKHDTRGFETAEAGSAADNVLLQRAGAIQREETGIAGGKALSKYVAGVKGMLAEWGKLPATERAAGLGRQANLRLKDAGVPECVIDVQDLAIGLNGNFDFTTWSIVVNKKPLEKDTVTTAELTDMADTMYHEARHCEQWFRIARWLAGTKGKKAKDISTEMGIPENIAKKAVANPLKTSSALASKFASKSTLAMEKKMLAEAAAWYENIYGTGHDTRNAVLNNLQPTGDAYREAKKKYDDGYLAANQKNNESAAQFAALKLTWEKAQVNFDEFLAKYKKDVKDGKAGVGDIAVAAFLENLRDAAEINKDAALQRWETDYAAVKKLTDDLEGTTDAADKAYKKYTSLTEEADAWKLGGRVQDAMKK